MSFYVQVETVANPNIVGLCLQPYHNHPKGCPNWGKKKSCPPEAKPVGKIIDMRRPTYCVYNVFDFAGHINKMRKKHPAWSYYQLRCCLYWQGTARKQLREKLTTFLELFLDYTVLLTPEACGVDVTATMASAGIVLEWPPENVVYQVALAGIGYKGMVQPQLVGM